MKTIDARFDETMISCLKSIIGQTLTKYKCDPFVFSQAVFGIVGIYTEQGCYALTNEIETLDHFGADEDVAVFRFKTSQDSEIHSLLDGISMVETPVGRKIKEIRIVNENQRLFKNNEQTYDVWVTRGIIIILEDDREISFEKQVWFSEMISVNRGENLIEQFTSASDFIEDWEVPYRAECERKTIILKH